MVTSEVAPVAVVRNSIAMVATALLPSAVIVTPRMSTGLDESVSHLLLVLGGTALGLLRSLPRSIRVLLMLLLCRLRFVMLLLCRLRFVMLLLCRLRFVMLLLCRLRFVMVLLCRLRFVMLLLCRSSFVMLLLRRLGFVMLLLRRLGFVMLLPLRWFAVLLSLLLILCVDRTNGSEQKDRTPVLMRPPSFMSVTSITVISRISRSSCPARRLFAGAVSGRLNPHVRNIHLTSSQRHCQTWQVASQTEAFVLNATPSGQFFIARN